MTALHPQDRILAAARAALRIVETEEDLWTLRVGAVVIDDDEAVLEKVNDGNTLGYAGWHSTGERTEYDDDDVDLPAVVLYEPQEGDQ